MLRALIVTVAATLCSACFCSNVCSEGSTQELAGEAVYNLINRTSQRLQVRWMTSPELGSLEEEVLLPAPSIESDDVFTLRDNRRVDGAPPLPSETFTWISIGSIGDTPPRWLYAPVTDDAWMVAGASATGSPAGGGESADRFLIDDQAGLSRGQGTAVALLGESNQRSAR